MGFASDSGRPVIDPARIKATYPTPLAALNAVFDDYAEYGHSIDPECYLPAEEFEAILHRRKELAEEFTWRMRYGLEERDLASVAADLAALAEDWYGAVID